MKSKSQFLKEKPSKTLPKRVANIFIKNLFDRSDKSIHRQKLRGKGDGVETPVFTKREPRPYDYQEMTWGKFIKLREWAKNASQEIGYPIYLVGSTLYKEVPRDFDVVVIIPQKEYEERFGELTESNFGEVLVKAFNRYVKEYFDCEETLGKCGHTPLDFKIYPDNWFIDNDKLLLAEPKR